VLRLADLIQTPRISYEDLSKAFEISETLASACCILLLGTEKIDSRIVDIPFFLTAITWIVAKSKDKMESTPDVPFVRWLPATHRMGCYKLAKKFSEIVEHIQQFKIENVFSDYAQQHQFAIFYEYLVFHYGLRKAEKLLTGHSNCFEWLRELPSCTAAMILVTITLSVTTDARMKRVMLGAALMDRIFSFYERRSSIWTQAINYQPAIGLPLFACVFSTQLDQPLRQQFWTDIRFEMEKRIKWDVTGPERHLTWLAGFTSQLKDQTVHDGFLQQISTDHEDQDEGVMWWDIYSYFGESSAVKLRIRDKLLTSVREVDAAQLERGEQAEPLSNLRQQYVKWMDNLESPAELGTEEDFDWRRDVYELS
jgi:hypothetical protein